MDTNDKIIEFVKTTSDKLDTAQDQYPYSFIHIHDERGEGENAVADDNLYIGEDRITDNFNIGELDTNTPTRALGSLQPSTIGELKKKSVSQILIDMLKVPVTVPTVTTNVSATISYSGSKLIEVGTNLSSKSNVTVTPKRGAWSDGTVYAGTATTTKNMSPDKWGEPSEEGVYSISAQVTFAAGGVPKDNYGASYPDLQYQGGTITTSTIKITAVKPIYVNDGDSIDSKEKHIVNYIAGGELDVTIPSEIEEPEVMKFKVWVPEQFTTFTVKQFNPITNQYDIDIPMVFVDGEEPYYERDEVSVRPYINTADTPYKINLKK